MQALETATPASPTYQSDSLENSSVLNWEPSRTPNTATIEFLKRGQEDTGAPKIAAIVTNDIEPSIQGSGKLEI